MADRIDDLAGRVEVIEQKVGQLSACVDHRFDQVDAALVEQRLYTEFAYERLDSKMDAGFGRLDAKMDAGFANMDGRFSRLERKLDQFIDTQSTANELVERRLQALEPPSATYPAATLASLKKSAGMARCRRQTKAIGRSRSCEM